MPESSAATFNLRAFARDVAESSARIFWTLFRIAFPILVAVRALDEAFGVVEMAGRMLSPLMSPLGLPGEAAVVWAAALLLNLYAALLMLAGMWPQLELTTAQATVLATVMLIAHALPVELKIAQKAGAGIGAMLAVRVVGALALGAILNAVYTFGNFLQEPASLYLEARPAASGWGEWLVAEAVNWAIIFAVVVAIVLFVRVMQVTHAERRLVSMMSPLMRRMGVGGEAASVTMIGMTLGLSYGGGLLIDAARGGRIGRRDMLCALAFLSLCHSVVEDTLAMTLIGAHMSGILFGRILFTFAFMLPFARAAHSLPEKHLAYLLAK